jgi:hypothetical protein
LINFPNFFKESCRYEALENRETCRHWIDYEIYDSLNEELKERYLNQFPIPMFISCKKSDEKKFSWRVHCKANHKDMQHQCIVDCCEFYPKTIKHMKKITKNAGLTK